MAAKTVEEQLAELDVEAAAPAPPSKHSKTSRTLRPKLEQEAVAMEELEALEALEKFRRPEAPRSSSRPATPRLSLSSATSSQRRTAGALTPSPTTSANTSEDKLARSPSRSVEDKDGQAAGGGGGGWWWGGLLSTATAAADAAKKQAEAAYQEIQKNQDAQRWADQVRGNVHVLRGIGGELGKRDLPTFTNILHTLAPPISQHERLQIHITHDLVGYPALHPLVYQTFAGVMAQVEGGDLIVIQRGSTDGYKGGGGGWNDGPWWRHTEKRHLSLINGLVQGTRLARVSAEVYADEFFTAKGGLEAAAKQASQALSESNPVRSSDIFIAIQAVRFWPQHDLFRSSAPPDDKSEVAEAMEDEEQVSFAIHLHDPIHGIQFQTLSQFFPLTWAAWLDLPTDVGAAEEGPQVPQEILQIIHTGGADPREWVSEWMEETINLSIGIVAQRYVARRMGVGEGGLGRRKTGETIVDAGGGEAARAGVI